MVLSSIAQDSVGTKPDSKSVLLHKAKNKSIAGWTLLGGGAAFTIAGAAVTADAIGGALDHNDYNRKTNTGAVLAVIGIATMVTSIPFLVKAHRLKKKAMVLTMTNNRVAIPQNGLLSFHSYPVLKLSMTIGNR